MNTKVLFIGNYCSSNRGDAAIIDGMLGDIRATIPDCEIRMTSLFQDVARKVHGVDTAGPWYWTESRSDVISARARFLLSGRSSLPKAYAWADIAVAVGGSYIHDRYHPAIVGRLLELKALLRAGVPTFLYSHSIGPFTRPATSKMASDVLERVDGITVRESVSRDQVEELSGRDVVIASDAAFMAPPGDPDIGDLMNRIEGISGSNGYITVSVRDLKGFYDKGVQDRTFKDLSGSLKDIAKGQGVGVVFVPMCTDMGGYRHDDRVPSKRLARSMRSDDRTLVVEGEPTHMDLRGIIAGARAHIGLRMHSNILALATGTPVVGIGYEHKTKGIMEDMGLSRYHFEAHAVSRKRLLSTAADLFKNEQDLREHISGEVENATTSAHQSSVLLKKIIDR